MKMMTCKQLGGACEKQFQANTFEEIAEMSKLHGMEMFRTNDEAHLSAMKEIQILMQKPDAMKNWFDSKKREFDALAEEQKIVFYEILEVLKNILVIAIVIFGLIYLIKDLSKHNTKVFKNIKKGLNGGLAEVCIELGMTITQQDNSSGEAEFEIDSILVKVNWVVGYQHGYDPSHTKTKISVMCTDLIDDYKIVDSDISINQQSLVLEIAGIDSDKNQLEKAIGRLISVYKEATKGQLEVFFLIVMKLNKPSNINY